MAVETSKENLTMFDRSMLLKLIIPVAIEQTLSVTVGMADMIMVSGAGEAAVSGISLVNSISILLVMLFAALASGGSVVVAQYLGSGNRDKACRAAEQQVLSCLLIAIALTVLALAGNRAILSLIYGSKRKALQTTSDFRGPTMLISNQKRFTLNREKKNLSVNYRD